ncbi:MAG: hypothetical protein U9Q98_11520, partial [Bacteroidota bacterium]|nr:hypothetical protein [Bacteroidota bacterium]
MKNFVIILLAFGFLLFLHKSSSYAQIVSCIPDETVVDTADPGQVEPDSLPPAVEGESYSQTITVIPPGSYEGMDI